MVYKGPWFDGEARFIIVIINRLRHKTMKLFFRTYYNHPGETEVQRLDYPEDSMSVDYYTGFD